MQINIANTFIMLSKLTPFCHHKSAKESWTFIQFIFRVLRQQDNPDIGLYPTDQSAQLTVKEHVERGGPRNFICSQFISTTKSLQVALRWVYREGSAVAIISCARLHSSISLDDFSSGHPSLDFFYNSLVIKHREVLVHPYINRSAVIRHYRYDELIHAIKSQPGIEGFLIMRSPELDCEDFIGHCSRYLTRTHLTVFCFLCKTTGHSFERCSRFERFKVARDRLLASLHQPS